jgi:hypothetical protein
MSKYVKTQAALAAELNMSRERLCKRYIKSDGAPEQSSKGYNVLEWKKFVAADRKRSLSGDGSLRDEKTLREIRKLDIEIERMEGNSKPMDQWLDEVRLLAEIVKGGLDHFIQRIAAEKRDPDLYKWAVECRDDVLSRLNEKVNDAG